MSSLLINSSAAWSSFSAFLSVALTVCSLSEARPKPAKASHSGRSAIPSRSGRSAIPSRSGRSAIPSRFATISSRSTRCPIRMGWDWNSGSVSRPSSLATRNATDFDLRMSISVLIASIPRASTKGEMGFWTVASICCCGSKTSISTVDLNRDGTISFTTPYVANDTDSIMAATSFQRRSTPRRIASRSIDGACAPPMPSMSSIGAAESLFCMRFVKSATYSCRSESHVAGSGFEPTWKHTIQNNRLRQSN